MTAKDRLIRNHYRDIYPPPERCPNCVHVGVWARNHYCKLVTESSEQAAWVTKNGICDRYEPAK